ncbi:MAG: DUF1320 domain-containing protein [Desulfitobacteriaceae bacterium]|nr:DUF1320 domain-containing protein [Desulfitobacteriaceae bacterium]
MYCSLDDLLGQIPKEKLIELSNDDTYVTTDTGEPTYNMTNIDSAINNASSEIDGYASTRYTVPFVNIPPVIKKLAVDIAVYNLFSRKWTSDEEDNIVRRYKNAIRLLERIAEGKVVLGAGESTILYKAPNKAFGDRFRSEYD